MTVVKNIPYWLFGLLLVFVLGCDSDAVGTDIDKDVPIEEEILPLLFDPTVYTSADLSEEDLSTYNELKNNPKVADLSIVRITDYWSLLKQPKFVIQIPNGPRLVATTQDMRHDVVERIDWEGHIQSNEGEGFALLGGGRLTIHGFIWVNGTGYPIKILDPDSEMYIVYRSLDEEAKSSTLPLLFEPTVYSPSDLSEESLARYIKILDYPETIEAFIVKVSQPHLTLQYPKFIVNLPNGVRLTATTQSFTPSNSGTIAWVGKVDLCTGDMNNVLSAGSYFLVGSVYICGTTYLFNSINESMHVVSRHRFVSCGECEGKAIRE